MTEIYNFGEKIAYTQGDTFELEVSSDSFEAGDTCLFVIAEDENAEPVVNSTFALSNGVFSLSLTSAEKKRLELGNYIYKIVVTALDGTVVTTIGGDFIVKWGA